MCDFIPPYQDIDGLNDVNKHLVLLVFDALRPPGDGVGDSGRYFGFCHLQLGTFLSDVSARGEDEASFIKYIQQLWYMSAGTVCAAAHSCRILLSVVCGNPKSISSSSSS